MSSGLELRKHQKELIRICDGIIRGEPVTRIIAHVTPGGGKSMLPVILAAKLANKAFEKLCWVAPRSALRRQAAIAFCDERFRSEFGHSFEIMEDDNRIDPSGHTLGYATTYQSIISMPELHADEFRRGPRYCLVLDENHHIGELQGWERAISPLVASASLVLFMSGTSDINERRVAFMEYDDCEGGEQLRLASDEHTRVIKYTRQDALREHAVVPMVFTHRDATMQWVEKDGVERDEPDFGDDTTKDEEVRRRIRVALTTEFAEQLTDQMLDDFAQYRERQYRDAQAIVLAPTRKQARYLETHIRNRGFRVALAITGKDDAQDAIHRFRDRQEDVLVTVGMAYEGLDAPFATHMACLTAIRTPAWLTQAFARITRMNPIAGPWEQQDAFFFLPDDPIMNNIIAQIEREQQAVVDDREQPPRQPRKWPPDDESIDDFLALSSSGTTERTSGIPNIALFAGIDEQWLQAHAAACGIDANTRMLAKFYDGVMQQCVASRPQDAHSYVPPRKKTAREREDELRSQIDRLVSQVVEKTRREFSDVNGEIKRNFRGKSRSDMREHELRQVVQFIFQRWGRSRFSCGA